MTTSVEYYNSHAEQFFAGTNEVDMTDIYQRFLPLIPEGGSILDAGCGSGRDAKGFKERGYDVDAFDASPALVELANTANGVQATVDTFDSYTSQKAYDGIWACASLLHVPNGELAGAIQKLSNLLKENGKFYLSFKMGSGEREANQRIFTDLTLERLSDIISQVPKLRIIDSWTTADLRPKRNDEWLNAILERLSD